MGARPFLLIVQSVLLLLVPIPASAQAPSAGSADAGDVLRRYARAYLEITRLQEVANNAFARAHEEQAKQQLRDRLTADIARVYESHGLTEADYERITWQVSTTARDRERFSALLEELRTAPPRP